MADDDTAPLQPRSDAEAVLDGERSAVLTTAARALVLGNALSSPAALTGMSSDLTALGFASALPRPWGGWENRVAAVAASDRVLTRYQALDEVAAREQSGYVADGDGPLRQARLPLWNQIASRRASPAEAIAWLRLVLTDSEPLAATAAASALSYWQKRQDVQVPAPLASAVNILDAMQRARDPEVVLLASARNEIDNLPTSAKPAKPVNREQVGAILHGTFGWPGRWWDTGGDFHGFVGATLCSHVYSGGAPFSWSGAYRGRHRKIAAERFARWAADVANGQLCCVFAHSYGGVIALMSSAYGTRIKNLILLSVPAETVPVEWRHIDRAVSLRIHADLVLLAARRRQHFTENVEENYLPQWFTAHSDSHRPDVWRAQGCARQLGLSCA